MTMNIKFLKPPFLIFLTISGLLSSQNSIAGELREYWIAAEKVVWNYAPTGKNLIRPKMGLGVWGQHLRYEKYRYIQYTDKTFTKKIPQPEWMGILGPQIRAEEGDTINVHFYNKADKPLSIHPHGLHYDEVNEGADMKNEGAMVKPGKKFTYTWTADHESAPGPADPSSIVWLYHSHVDSVTEIYDGLIGSIIITKKGMARSKSDPRPKDVEKAFTTMYMIFDENGRKIVGPIKHFKRDSNEEEVFEEGNLKHAINGYIYGNLPGLEMQQGDRVRWHLLAMGTEVDLHTAHWHGKTVLNHGRRTDVVELLPASMVSVDMNADNPGNWLYHCHVTDHITAGMATRFQILPKSK